MNSWYVYEQVKCDQVHKHYITCKHILIKQDQSLKNDYNEHLASKFSFGHAMQLLNQCKIHEVYAFRIQDPTRVQVWGTKDILAIS